MRATLNKARATRTSEQLKQFGDFRFQEVAGPNGEVIFMGQGAAATTSLPTITVITRQGHVYRMKPSGITGIVENGLPKVVKYDLQLGNAELMAK